MNALLKQLNEMYAYAWKNEFSDMYRKLHSTERGPFSSLEEWEKVPTITKKDLLQFSYKERLFVPDSEVDTLRSTSGTTSDSVLVVPRNGFIDTDLYFKHKQPKGWFAYYQPQHVLTRALQEANIESPVIHISLSDIEGSVRLAKQAGVDHLICFTFVLRLLYPYLKKYNMLNDFIEIEPYGEYLSDSELAEVRAMFPNAKIQLDYSAAELQNLAGTQPDSDFQNSEYQPTKRFYWEIIDERGDVIEKEGVEGELVLTTLHIPTTTMPLLRYKTGDLAQRAKNDPDPHKCRFKILGRTNLDMIKISGGAFVTHYIAQSLKGLHKDITDDFEFHYYVQKGAHGTRPAPILFVRAQSNKDFTESLIQELAATCAERLRISPNLSYADGVKKDLLEPLQLRIVNEFEQKEQKRVRLIRHD